MTIVELTAAAGALKQIEATVATLRGAFLVSGDISFSRQCNDIGILVSDLLQQVEAQIATGKGQP